MYWGSLKTPYDGGVGGGGGGGAGCGLVGTICAEWSRPALLSTAKSAYLTYILLYIFKSQGSIKGKEGGGGGGGSVSVTKWDCMCC